MSSQSPSTLHVPVLTEIIEAKSAEQPAEPVTEPSAEQQSQAQIPFPSLVTHKKKWDELEHRLTERILQLVQERISFILADSLRESLSTVLNKASEELASEVRKDLQNTLEVVVSHAVSQEIMRLQQNSSNKSDSAKGKGGG